MTLDEIIQHAKDDSEVISPVGRRNVPRTSWASLADDFDVDDLDDEPFGMKPAGKKKRASGDGPKLGKSYKRRVRCKKCSGCLVKDCRKCVFCK